MLRMKFSELDPLKRPARDLSERACLRMKLKKMRRNRRLLMEGRQLHT